MTTKEEFKEMYIDSPTGEIDSIIAGRFYAKIPNEDPFLSALLEIIDERIIRIPEGNTVVAA